jgi:hypothetical protein
LSGSESVDVDLDHTHHRGCSESGWPVNTGARVSAAAISCQLVAGDTGSEPGRGGQVLPQLSDALRETFGPAWMAFRAEGFHPKKANLFGAARV